MYNRHYLESQLPGEIRRSQFSAKQSPSTGKTKQDLLCLLIDIDHFKRINDDYGHIAGDKVLSAFANVLKEVFRQTDLIIRWGGEEFLVVCRQSTRESSLRLPSAAEKWSQHPF
ncbi:GGDEF domain-containing protein [Alteromonas macleodii]|uniref:GGDEF domain-containing protein n=1 Tax=Alteromonas macleodii TaxID=28108 RepID=UPI001E4C65ED|nr:GGDEF domain-containing protein [Alteromonas macleodii]